MGQAGPYMRRVQGGYTHWCPACGEVHTIYDSWTFNGDVNKPTFSPSVKVGGVQKIVDAQGKWAGDWKRGPDGNPLPQCCHYFLRDGQIQFCGDCTHAMSGQTVPLPELPDWLRD